MNKCGINFNNDLIDNLKVTKTDFLVKLTSSLCVYICSKATLIHPDKTSGCSFVHFSLINLLISYRSPQMLVSSSII